MRRLGSRIKENPLMIMTALVLSTTPGCVGGLDQTCHSDNDSCTPEGSVFGGGLCCRGECTTASFIDSQGCGACNATCPESTGCGQVSCGAQTCAKCLPLICMGLADDSPCALASGYLPPGICCNSVCVSAWSSDHCGACQIACPQPQGCTDGLCGECAEGSNCGAGEGCIDLRPFTGGGTTCAQVCEGSCPTGSGCETDAGCLPVCAPPDGTLRPAECAVCSSASSCPDAGS